MKICMFGASSNTLRDCYYEQARQLGRLIGRRGHTMIFGGGANGLMGACARGVAESGGEVVGVVPRPLSVPAQLYEDSGEIVYTESIAERKQKMVALADAFVALPGGIGTLDELFDVLTLRQLSLTEKPVVLLNTEGFFASLDALLRGAAKEGFLGEDLGALYRLCDEPQAALAALEEEQSVRRFSQTAEM